MAKRVDAPNGEPVYLFDIANRLRQDKAVKESLVTAINSDKAHDYKLVAHLILEEGEQMNYELLKRLDDDLAAWLPKGVEVLGYKQQDLFRMSFICKTDATYYGTELDGYLKPVGGKLKAVSF
jgi:hypothetical protein